MFAEIIISSAAKELDRGFHYAIPPHLMRDVSVGKRVKVPFGKARSYEGFVVGLANAVDIPADRIKEIEEVLEDFPIFSPSMLKLARWMSQKYSTTLASCLRCIMPAGIAMKNDYIAEIATDADAKTLKGKSRQIFDYLQKNGATGQRELTEVFGDKVFSALKSLEERKLIIITHIYKAKNYQATIAMAYLDHDNPDFDALAEQMLAKNDKQSQVLALLMENLAMPIADIRAVLHVSPSPIKSLESRGLIRVERTQIRRDLFADRQYAPPDPIEPTADQAHAIAVLRERLAKGASRPILLHGVTGSGKTEVYLQIVEQVMAQGKQAIILVPEISLTPQAIEVFARRLGSAVTFTHSRLSLGERYDQWKCALDGQVSVMIGPRSAIFTPFANLGVIIIDEEHENTYKSETSPKYHVNDVACELASLTGAMVIMGSATPDVGTYYEAKTGRYELLTLPERVNQRVNQVEIADMRRELAEGNRTIFSKILYDAIESNLASKQQTILFLNRRGHSTFVSCRACGHALQCGHCNVNYTYHILQHRLMCHYCAAQSICPENCPICGSKHIKFFGVGTQRIEQDIAQFFPQARSLRMDMDTTGRKHSHERIISAFASGEADILIGTQMIAKGLNFPQVSLVGIIAADVAINTGDYRSAEVAYQLMTQVAGRAGRADLPGRAIIQTYNPEHYAIAHAVDNNYDQFYEQEITFRRQMFYPPFSHVAMMLFTGTDERKIIAALHKLSDIMNRANRKGLCQMLGPSPAIISKIRGLYRWKILVKCEDEDVLKQFVAYCMGHLEKNADITGINVNLTVDPKNIV